MTELLWDCRCTVGESPIWDPVRRRVWFTDIPAGRLHAWSVDSAARTVWDLRDGAAPATLASIGLCRSGRLVLALRDRVVLFHPGSGEMQDLTASFGLPARVRLNDGKVGPDGAFWVGSMDMGEPVDHPDQLPLGTLFRVAPDGTVTRAVEEVTISNGLAWSPDGRTMYYADTHGVWIDAIAFDPATGALGERRRLVAPDEGAGRADGGATDSEGGYWSAGVAGGVLNRWSADGGLLARLPMPVSSPTALCFTENGQACLTSLRPAGDTVTASGGLFRLNLGVAGSPVGLFDA
jgi:sugar lactone lactonase YvrE